MTSNAELTFGAVALLSPNPAAADYVIEATADGTTWGTPEAVVATVASMLMDGERASITRFGNREASIPLQVRGDTLDAVAAGEAALMVEVNKGRNVLTWLPPGWSTASVFDVIYSVLSFEYDDLAEVNQVTRHFTLTLVCLPFARRAESTTVVAEPIPVTSPTVTVIDACTSLTGWAATYSTLSLSAGHILITGTPTGSVHWDAERAGLAAPVGVERYLTVDLAPTAATPSVLLNSVTEGVLAATEAITGGLRFYFRIPSSVTTITSLAVAANTGGPVTLMRVAKTDQLPYVGSLKQRSFSVSVGGTARTAVDVAIESDSGAVLGSEVLLFTAPRGAAVSPSMRPWLVSSSGTPTTSAGTVSGKYHNGNASTYERPVAITPPGQYLIMARALLVGGGISGVSWTASTIGHDNYTIAASETGSTVLNLTGSYVFYPLGVVTLPPSAISPDIGASIRIQLVINDGGVRLDDLWLFNLDLGVLSWVQAAGLGVVGSRFAALNPSLDRSNPTWVSGTAGSAAQDVDVARLMQSPGVHELLPGDSDIFLITTSATDQVVTADFFERFQHHVSPPES